MEEKTLVIGTAMVFKYKGGQWHEAGKGTGKSEVYFLKNFANDTCRIVALKGQSEECVVNSCVLKDTNFKLETATFFQWKDDEDVFGVNFQSEEDASSFNYHFNEAIADASAPKKFSNDEKRSPISKPPSLLDNLPRPSQSHPPHGTVVSAPPPLPPTLKPGLTAHQEVPLPTPVGPKKSSHIPAFQPPPPPLPSASTAPPPPKIKELLSEKLQPPKNQNKLFPSMLNKFGKSDNSGAQETPSRSTLEQKPHPLAPASTAPELPHKPNILSLPMGKRNPIFEKLQETSNKISNKKSDTTTVVSYTQMKEIQAEILEDIKEQLQRLRTEIMKDFKREFGSN